MKSKTEELQIQNASTMECLVECDEIIKFFMADGLKVMALQGVDLKIKTGEIMAIIGKSGSGKSTLLNMIGCLDTPTTGKLIIAGTDVSTMTEKNLENFRKKTVGFVWQNPLRNLFPYMNVISNVTAPMIYTGMKPSEKKKRAMELLRSVGMEAHAKSYPLKLSGGQQQRVAIAVALANNPKLLLADEPTGAVDRKTTESILKLFAKLRDEQGITIIIVTHDTAIARQVDRVVEISDGKISTEKIRKEAAFSGSFDELEEQESFSVLDRAGRVKLSDEALEKAGITSNRVRVETEDGKIIIKPE